MADFDDSTANGGGDDHDFDTDQTSSGVIKPESRTRSRSPRRSSRGGVGSGHFCYLTNLPFATKWTELKDIIRNKVGDISRVDIIEERSGRSKGSGVAEFKDLDAAEKCAKLLDGTKLDDREIGVQLVRDPIPFFRKIEDETGKDYMRPGGGRGGGGGGGDRNRRDRSPPRRMSGIGMMMSNEPMMNRIGLRPNEICNRVFVADLPFHTQPSRVKDLFSVAGKVTGVELYLDKDGKSKGIAVVEFQYPFEAVQAISMLQNQWFCERKLVVKMDRHEASQPRRSANNMPDGLRNLGPGLGDRGETVFSLQELMMTRNRELAYASAPMETSMYASQQQQQHQQIRSFEQPRPEMSMSYAGRSTGDPYGRGSMEASMDSAYRSQAMAQLERERELSLQRERMLMTDRYQMGGGPGGGGGMGGDRGMPMSVDRYPPAMTSTMVQSGGGGSMGPPQSYNRDPRQASWGEAPRSMSGSGAPPRSTGDGLLIRNLPPSFTWQRLKDLGREAGEIQHVEVINPGVGTMRFKTYSDCDRARRFLHGYSVEGYTLTCDFA